MKKNLIYISLFLTLVTTGSWFTAKTVATWNWSLQESGNWESTKVKLQKSVIGAISAFNGYQTLRDGRLNLGMWHGYQRFLLKDKTLPTQIKFDAFVSQNSYLQFLFGHSEKQFFGIRFSKLETHPNIIYLSKPNGEFIWQKPVAFNFHGQEKLEFIIDFKSSDITVTDKTSGQKEHFTLPKEIEVNSQIGFQGALSNSSVDNIYITKNSGTSYISFENHDFMLKCFTLSIFCFVFLLGFILRESKSKQYFTLMIIFIFTISSIGIFSYHTFHRSQIFPGISEWQDTDSEYLLLPSEEYVEQTVQTLKEAQTRPRVLFFGGSQTWGSGAQRFQDSFVARIRENLKEDYESINFGISGFSSSDLLKPYLEHMFFEKGLKYVFIILGTNDSVTTPDKFYKNISTIIKKNNLNKIKTLLVLEANSSEYPENLSIVDIHDQLRKLSKDYSLPLLDLNSYMDEQSLRGNLWWDFVHLSSFGHELAAKRLLKFFHENK